MSLPNFLIIGAQRAGTTSLYHYLKQHPEILMSPVKEPGFFAWESGSPAPLWAGNRRAEFPFTDADAYRSLFRGRVAEKAVGEASTIYLYSRTAPAKIREWVPDVKLVAVLRDPVERAYSAYCYLRRDGREPIESFSRALDAETERSRTGWESAFAYAERGLYHRQLERYYELFPQTQIRVYLYEDMLLDPLNMLQDLFRFLEVDADFRPDTSARKNASGIPRNALVRRLRAFAAGPHPIKTSLRGALSPAIRRRLSAALLETLGSHGLDQPPRLADAARARLIDGYREEIGRLEDLIRRDLSHWGRGSSLPEPRRAAESER